MYTSSLICGFNPLTSYQEPQSVCFPLLNGDNKSKNVAKVPKTTTLSNRSNVVEKELYHH